MVVAFFLLLSKLSKIEPSVKNLYETPNGQTWCGIFVTRDFGEGDSKSLVAEWLSHPAPLQLCLSWECGREGGIKHTKPRADRKTIENNASELYNSTRPKPTCHLKVNWKNMIIPLKSFWMRCSEKVAKNAVASNHPGKWGRRPAGLPESLPLRLLELERNHRQKRKGSEPKRPQQRPCHLIGYWIWGNTKRSRACTFQLSYVSVCCARDAHRPVRGNPLVAPVASTEAESVLRPALRMDENTGRLRQETVDTVETKSSSSNNNEKKKKAKKHRMNIRVPMVRTIAACEKRRKEEGVALSFEIQKLDNARPGPKTSTGRASSSAPKLHRHSTDCATDCATTTTKPKRRRTILAQGKRTPSLA